MSVAVINRSTIMSVTAITYDPMYEPMGAERAGAP
jgi:hypothetical protein